MKQTNVTITHKYSLAFVNMSFFDVNLMRLFLQENNKTTNVICHYLAVPSLYSNIFNNSKELFLISFVEFMSLKEFIGFIATFQVNLDTDELTIDIVDGVLNLTTLLKRFTGLLVGFFYDEHFISLTNLNTTFSLEKNDILQTICATLTMNAVLNLTLINSLAQPKSQIIFLF
jgi:hypothetical protein